MATIKKIFCIYFFVLFFSCTVNSQENPAGMFIELYDKYKTTNIEKQTVDSNLNDGMGMYLFDVEKKYQTIYFADSICMLLWGKLNI